VKVEAILKIYFWGFPKTNNFHRYAFCCCCYVFVKCRGWQSDGYWVTV